MIRFRQILLTLSSGVLLVLSFPPFNFGYLAWIALVPFLMATRGVSPRVATRLGFFLGLVYFGGTLNWLYRIFGWPFVALIGMLAIFCAVFGLGLSLLNRKIQPYLMTWAVPALWVATESFRSECWYFRFSFVGLGYSQQQNLAILQLASLFGVYGISFLIVLVNVSIHFAITNLARKRQISVVLSQAAAIVLLVLFCAKLTVPVELKRNITVAAIQDESSNLSNYVRLTESINDQRPDLVVWPEFSLFSYALSDLKTMEVIANLARKVNSYLIFGCKDYVDGRKPPAFHNTAVLISPEGEVVGKYYKLQPVQLMIDGAAGKEYSTFPTGIGKIGIAICYDNDFSLLVRKLVASGAEIIVVPTYDAVWWGKIQHEQHAGMTPFRAVETRRFIVRAASSGISQVVDPYGRILESLRFGERGTLVGKVTALRNLTFYTRYGYLFIYLCQTVTLALIGFVLFAQRRYG